MIRHPREVCEQMVGDTEVIPASSISSLAPAVGLSGSWVKTVAFRLGEGDCGQNEACPRISTGRKYSFNWYHKNSSTICQQK